MWRNGYIVMRVLAFCLTLLSVAAAQTASLDSLRRTVSIQAIDDSVQPVVPLAEIQYTPSTLTADLVLYDAPYIPASSRLVRIGIYDASVKSWKSAISITATESFKKGYAPTFIISLNENDDIVGVACRATKIDAGLTRDFSPRIKVVRTEKGKTPELNKPVVVSKDGKVEGQEPEKTFLQKCVLRMMVMSVHECR
jgi:hypothetical protein